MRLITRRRMLRGVGGVAVALPFLEGWEVADAAATDPGFAFFFRQPDGVAAETLPAQETCSTLGAFPSPIGGMEPERFWPRQAGPLSVESVQGRALDELTQYLEKLLVVRVNTSDYQVGEPHSRATLQCLTGTGPVKLGEGSSSLANGESIDHRIGRELNPGGRDSLFLYTGRIPGYLGGPCISYRSPGVRRAALNSPFAAYQFITGGSAANARTHSLNDLVRKQLVELLGNPILSADDKQKLDLHFSSIRDLEVNLSCMLKDDQARMLDAGTSLISSDNGEDRIRVTQLHMDVAVLAIACGQTRSVALQFGSGNDGNTRFVDPETGVRMENYHFISHRLSSDGFEGALIPGSDVLHHKIDRYFGKMFKYLLDRLAAYSMPGGGTLLDAGITAWFNELGTGPTHSPKNVPWVIAGSAGGRLKQGLYAIPGGPDEVNHPRLLSTLGAVLGVKNAGGQPLDDFGDPSLPKGQLNELLT